MGPYHGPLSFFLVARITCNYSFFLTGLENTWFTDTGGYGTAPPKFLPLPTSITTHVRLEGQGSQICTSQSWKGKI